jgi:tetratricopeptide (TPR) repeat protein
LTDEAAQAFIEAFVPRLEHALGEHDFKDSPIFQLIPALGPYPLPHDVTDSFRQRSHDLNAVRERLAAASRAGKEGKERIGQIEAELGEINQTNAELFVDVLLSYRDVEAFDEMIVLGERLPSWLKSRVPMAEEQVAFALNRRFRLPDRRPDDRDRAIGMLEALIERNGDSPETSSLLARVYKDDYLEAVERGEAARARGSLRRAIELYRRGFDADPRDYYPGINLATLLTLAGTPEALAEFGQVAPAVAFAIRRAGGLTSRNYWLAATALELAVLRGDAEMTRRALDHVATIAMQPWMPKTTLNNLAILQRASDEALNKILLAEATADLTALWEELKARA